MNRLSKILFYLLMVILYIPMAQQEFDFVKIGRLQGAIKKIKQPPLSSETWYSENYQKGTEKYLTQNFGFANWFIRIENQIQYTFYNKAKANGVIIGKEKYLFEKGYIDTYYGRDFIGKKRIRENYSKLKIVIDTLQKLNIHVLIVFAPGKASFYPEYIPDYLKSEKKITNLMYSVLIADSLGLDYIDMSTWFINMKDTASYPLYPKTGTHWSFYGVKLAIDTLVSYSRNKFGLNLPSLSWKDIEMKNKLKRPDHDIELSMNMIFEIPNHPMPVVKPIYGKQNDSTSQMLAIADSYFAQLYNMKFSSKFFKDGQYWFYNKKVKPKRSKRGTRVRELDVRKEILNQDLIILMTTEPFIKRDHFGFANMAYEAIFNPNAQKEYKKEISLLIKTIKSNPKWMISIKKKALARNVSIDSMIVLDAMFAYKQKLKKELK